MFSQDLKAAVKANDAVNVRSVLQQTKWLVNRVDCNNNDNTCSCLCVAAKSGSIDVTKALLEADANVNMHCLSGHTPLTTAVEQSHVEMVRLLLAQPAIMVDLAHWSETPLQIATRSDFKEIAQLLLAAKANIDQFIKKEAGPTRHQRFVTFLFLCRYFFFYQFDCRHC